MTQNLSLGDRVMYRLTADDADTINRRRRQQQEHRDARHPADPYMEVPDPEWDPESGEPQPMVRVPVPSRPDFGLMGHVGADVDAGDERPAIVVGVRDDGWFGLQAFLDGNDVQWVQAAKVGDGPGEFWPI